MFNAYVCIYTYITGYTNLQWVSLNGLKVKHFNKRLSKKNGLKERNCELYIDL